MKWRHSVFLGFVAFFILPSCSTTKLVPAGDALYSGAEIEIAGEVKKKQKQKLSSDLDKILKPKPNKKWFGLPIKLAIYTALYNGKEKGIKASIRKKFGEAPVLYSSVNPIFIKEVLNSEMFNRGYFHAITSFSILEDEKRKKTKVKYLINAGIGFRIKEYNPTVSDTAINTVIAQASSKPELKKHRHYNLDKLKDERTRIDGVLKNKGYYYFGPDYLMFQVDSNEKTKDLYVQLKLKDDVPEKALKKYTIKKVLVVMDSTYSFDSLSMRKDTVLVEGVHICVSRHFHHKPIARYVFLKEGQIYSREDHQLTLNRLMGMGLFQYVNLTIDETDSLRLNVKIHLAPLPKKSISAEVQAVTKSNNFVGPRLNLSYTDRNLLKGGEKFTASFHGSVETQLAGQFKGLYTYEIGPSFQLSIPRFILPFRVKAPRLFTPTTVFGIDYDFTRRVGYFDMNSLRLSYMYKWKETLTKDHEFTPAYITVFSVRNIDSLFQSQLNQNPSLKRRYEDQMIPGTMYSYTYNEQSIQDKKNQLYFQGIADVAGNLAALVAQTPFGETKNGVRNIGNIAYAQFARFSFDLRDYLTLKKRSKTQLVGRMYVGLGLPYGNSKSLPYVKSYFSGGPYSIRAFTVNSLGPGTYRSPDFDQNLYFAQIGGDVKLEWNLEYRFPIVSILKGALFADAGNTWLLNANPDIPGGQFLMKNALKESALGVGVGVRVDITFFVIRLDVATPIRKPWLPDTERWVGKQIQLNDPQWRKENILFNIAIGYPF